MGWLAPRTALAKSTSGIGESDRRYVRAAPSGLQIRLDTSNYEYAKVSSIDMNCRSLAFLCCLLAGCPWSEPPAVNQAESPEEQAGTPDRDRVSPSAGTNDVTLIAPLAESPFLQADLRKEDPALAGWESEVFHQQADSQLKKLGQLLVAGNLEHGVARKLAAASFQSTDLRPSNLQKAFGDDAVAVFRGDAQAIANKNVDLAGRLAELLEPLEDAADKRYKFKTLRVELSGDEVETTTDFQLSGEKSEGVVQLNATWDILWTRESPPKIQSIRVRNYEEIVPGARGRLAFADIAPAVLGENEAYREQLVHGYDYWRERTDRALGSDLGGNQGIAIGDVNGDGLDDVYVMQPGGLPNRLFLHQPDGTAKDISAEARVDYADFSRDALFLDLDGDDDQDLVLGLNPGWIVLENDGKGRFSERASYFCPASLYSLTAADFDGDGDLDIYVGGRYPQGALIEETRVQGLPIPYHDANNGGPNSLWRNEGDWRFVDVTREVGLDVNNRRFTVAASWEDYDNDGDQDLYVANDFGRNNLYRNDGGKFTDVAAIEGVEDIGAGMSACWGDYNGDGFLDLYVANMFSAAGHRVASQKQFMPGVDERTRQEFQRHARGNSLFLNHGPREGADFEDVTLEADVNLGRWAWGSMFVDLNGDGWEDLFVANGFITTEDTGDL